MKKELATYDVMLNITYIFFGGNKNRTTATNHASGRLNSY